MRLYLFSELLIFHVLWACIVLLVNTYYTNWWETNTANQLITNLIACLIMAVFFLVAYMFFIFLIGGQSY